MKIKPFYVFFNDFPHFHYSKRNDIHVQVLIMLKHLYEIQQY